MHPLVAQLLAEAPVMTDGAWGTLLQAHGLPRDACADAWNVTHPEVVEQIARDYVAAGSRILLTNTFRANRLALAAHGLTGNLQAINQAGVALARRAGAGKAHVFGSSGPSGCRATQTERTDAFAEQAESLAAAGAEGLVMETFTDLDEACLAVAAARRVGLPVVASMVVVEGKLGGHLPGEAAAWLADAGAEVLGANCGSPDQLVELCRCLRLATDLPLWFKPHAGLPHLVEGRLIYPMTPREFAAYGPAFRHAGADFLGGCCGTTPDFIRALRQG
jgi:methionine synthase I (cobalamin-dependent)